MDNLEQYLLEVLNSGKNTEKYYSNLQHLHQVSEDKYKKLLKVLMLLHKEGEEVSILDRMIISQDAKYEYNVLFKGTSPNEPRIYLK